MTDYTKRTVESLRFMAQAVPGWSVHDAVLSMRSDCAIATLEGAADMIESLVHEREAFLDLIVAQFDDCPCNFSPLDEMMFEWCDADDCQSHGRGCWERVMKMCAERGDKLRDLFS